MVYSFAKCHFRRTFATRNQEINSPKFLQKSKIISNQLKNMSYEKDDNDPYDGPFNDNKS